MDSKLILVKCLTLLYRESLLPNKDPSADLVANILNTIKISEISLGVYSEREVLVGLKNTVSQMVKTAQGSEFDSDTILQQIKINCMHDEKLYEIISRSITESPSMAESSLKRSVTNLVKDLNNFLIEEQISIILTKASLEFRNNRDKIRDVNEFITSIVGQLEPLQITNGAKDPAILGEVDIGNKEHMVNVFKEIKSSQKDELVMKTGWQALNRMTQGGFRRGELTLISALQHNNKTGFTLSIFKQIALYNKPYMVDATKKPMLLRISTEDSLSKNLEFLYHSLKTDETSDHVNVSDLSEDEVSAYVTERLEVNGYHIRFLRVDPNGWTYKSICNKVIELEAQGYEIHLLMIDYLGMIPTTGCINSGPAGTDLRDLFRRMRNFIAAKSIALITPHQVSTQGKALVRSGVNDFHFVKEVAGKGYYAGSGQLDQEVDLEIYLHIAKYQKNSYLTVQRGKHRINSILDEKDMYFILKFPKKTPIPDDILGSDSSMRSVASEDATEELFKIG